MFGQLQFYFTHSINDLRVNGRRTLFALLCIAAGVAAIVSLQTLGVMIDKALTGSLRESNGGDIRILPNLGFDENGDFSAPDSDQREEDGIVNIVQGGGYEFTPVGIQTIQAWFQANYDGDIRLTYQNGVADTSGISMLNLDQDTDKAPIFPYFIDAENYPLFGSIETNDGQSLADALQNPTDVVIAQNLADDLGAEVGDTVRLSQASQDFTITGIVPTDSEGGLQNILQSILGYYYLDFDSLALFEGMRPEHAAVIYIALDDSDLNQVDDLSEAFTAEYPYLSTVTTKDIEELNSQISNTVNDLVAVMGLVAMLIGGIGIVNTMMVIVSRRTTEVAVLKTIGMEPENITLLFLVEAIIMGVIGSLGGILLGWLMAFGLQGFAERFVGESLQFAFAIEPPVNGFIIGIIITAIFGFIPVLSAGQVRPAVVLRPNEDIIPSNGLLRSFAALMFLAFAVSLLTQTVLSSIFNFSGGALIITAINGAVIGAMMTVPIIINGFLAFRRQSAGKNEVMLGLSWLALLVGGPGLGGLFGYFVPSVLVVTVTFILIGSLYLLLLLLIWAVGGGRLKEFPIIGGFPIPITILVFGASILWTAFTAFILFGVGLEGDGLALFLLLLLPIHIPTIIITAVLPGWALGQLLQRFGFLDLKIALRAMVATKTRGAWTLLALVIGIFTLSVITMLVSSIIDEFNELLENELGGNVIIFTAGQEDTINEVRTVLDEHPGVISYAQLESYNADFIRLEDTSTGDTLELSDLETRITDYIEGGEDPFLTEDDIEDTQDSLNFTLNGGVDARELDSNLPNVDFYDGRQLDPIRDREPDENGEYPLVLSATTAVVAADIDVNDRITYALPDHGGEEITFRIVGLLDNTGGNVEGVGGSAYTSADAFGDLEPSQSLTLVDVEEAQIPSLRRQLNEINGVFVLETKLFNELITSIIRQFTSFPLLVAGLALFTGGIVIANSVALATLERRREIGIMKAVGLQRERVLGMLLLENGLMGLVGGLIGVGAAVLIIVLLLSGIFGGGLFDVLPVGNALLLMLACIVIALVAAIISVWGASGEKPMNVLRYE